MNNKLLDDNTTYILSEFYKVFADSTRLKILGLLLDKELCVTDIANILNMSQSSISHQLQMLRQHDLVKIRKDGKQIYYTLSDNHIELILKFGIEHISEVKNIER